MVAIMILMAVTSTGAAEVMAAASILVYDIYQIYLKVRCMYISNLFFLNNIHPMQITLEGIAQNNNNMNGRKMLGHRKCTSRPYKSIITVR